MGLLGTVAVAVWAMLPAYVPNNVAVVVGGGAPLDGGRTWRGRRLLGGGKTWRGTLGGWFAGMILAVLLNVLQPIADQLLGLGLPAFPPAAAVSLPLGAMFGDIAASFLKRRSGRARGAPLPVVDQLDFVVGALVAALIVTPGWFIATFTPAVLVAVVVLTPVLHVATNGIAYVVGLKDEPW
ncbi:MAG: CDP-2,3-bis-(O-geranylgeranyl)-sn-glycerol synthase [Salinirussus sp.]